MENIHSQQFIDAIFDAEQAKTEGTVRRSIRTVQESATEEMLVNAVKARGFHLLQTKTDYVVLCNDGWVKILV